MKLLFIGDTHGLIDLEKAKRAVAEQALMQGDAIFHLGDIGVAWEGCEDEALQFWRSLACNVIVCLGNHENHPWIEAQPLITRHACRGYALGERMFAPLAGETLAFGGFSFWFYPGGYSIDFSLRTPGQTIFRQELLSAKQAKDLVQHFLQGLPVDFILSHDGPRSFVSENFGFPIQPPTSAYYRFMGEPEGSRAHPGFLLEQIYQHPGQYGHWFFGHHHRDFTDGKHSCLWKNIAILDTDSRLITMKKA